MKINTIFDLQLNLKSPKMEKTTFKKPSGQLANRLVKYGALSVAMAGVADASGQIVYTDVNPDVTNGGGGTSDFIDINNDGINDFVIGTTADAIGFNGINPTDSWVGSEGSYLYPFALDSGDPISAGNIDWYGGPSNVGTLNYNSCYSGAGASNWCGVTDKYLGLRFQIAGNTHYGWARLDVTLPADSFTLKDYAYNTVADAPINAGQTTLSTEEFSSKTIKIVALNESIRLSNLFSKVDYQLFDISGKVVSYGITYGDSHEIKAHGISKGIHILELRDQNSETVIIKKLIL